MSNEENKREKVKTTFELDSSSDESVDKLEINQFAESVRKDVKMLIEHTKEEIVEPNS